MTSILKMVQAKFKKCSKQQKSERPSKIKILTLAITQKVMLRIVTLIDIIILINLMLMEEALVSM